MISPHLGGQNDALVAEVDVDGPQVCPTHGGAVQDGDLGKRGQGVPLSINVVSVPDDHNILEIMIPGIKWMMMLVP